MQRRPFVVYVLFDCLAMLVGYNYNTVLVDVQEHAFRKLFFLHKEMQEVCYPS